jgi:hypothetical protein
VLRAACQQTFGSLVNEKNFISLGKKYYKRKFWEIDYIPINA